jgi:hypothetical protein
MQVLKGGKQDKMEPARALHEVGEIRRGFARQFLGLDAVHRPVIE